MKARGFELALERVKEALSEETRPPKPEPRPPPSCNSCERGPVCPLRILGVGGRDFERPLELGWLPSGLPSRFCFLGRTPLHLI